MGNREVCLEYCTGIRSNRLLQLRVVGYLPDVDKQTETITFPDPSDARGKYVYKCERMVINI